MNDKRLPRRAEIGTLSWRPQLDGYERKHSDQYTYECVVHSMEMDGKAGSSSIGALVEMPDGKVMHLRSVEIRFIDTEPTVHNRVDFTHFSLGGSHTLPPPPPPPDRIY